MPRKQGYEDCSLRQRAIVDHLMSGDCIGDRQKDIAEHFGMAVGTVKKHLETVYIKYRIDRSLFVPMVRLVYLRALELGLIRAA